MFADNQNRAMLTFVFGITGIRTHCCSLVLTKPGIVLNMKFEKWHETTGTPYK